MKGRTTNKILAIAGSATLLLALAGVGVLWYYSCLGPGYYSELNAVVAEFRKMPHVELVEINGVDDLFLEHISARIRVQEKGEMVFFNLDRDSFRGAKHLRLCSVGPYTIRVEGEGYVGVFEAASGKPVRSQFFGGDADIGPNGEFAKMFPFQISTIQSAVDRYDDIYYLISGWPQKSAKGHFRDAKGTEFYYYIETNEVQQAAAPNAASPHR